MSGRHLTVVAAGTGGHVMPGLAVAEALRARGWSVSWLGTRAGMERSLVEPRGITFDAVDFAGLRGKGFRTLLAGGFHLLRAFGQSLRILRGRSPAVVFSTGGYVAVPAGLATAIKGSPLVLLNADAAPLLSTRILRSFTASICCGFEGGAARWAGDKGLVSGNPVRPDIAQLDAPGARYAGRSGALNVLAIGGSLGARVLNETLPAAIALLAQGERPRVVHQCGAANVDATRVAYAAAGVSAEVLPFIDDMAARYTAADLVICRAGAITVSELCAAGVPSVLIPFVVRTTQHQRSNAQLLAQHDAAIHLPQAELDPQRLAAILRTLTRERLVAMALNARALGKPNATRTVADVIERIANARGGAAPAMAGGR